MINLESYDVACAGQARLIWSIITRCIRDHNDRMDIFHDSLLRFTKHYATPEKRKVAASTAAYHCAKNSVWNYYRKKEKHRECMDALQSQPPKYDCIQRSYSKDEQQVLIACRHIRQPTLGNLSQATDMKESQVMRSILSIREKFDDNMATKMATRFTENHVS